MNSMIMWAMKTGVGSILAQAGGGQSGGNSNVPAFLQPQVVMIVIMVLMFYFLMIRPQMKKQKEHEKMVQGLKSGDRVVTNGGIHGVITNIKDKTVLVRVAENVKIELERESVVSVSGSSEESETKSK